MTSELCGLRRGRNEVLLIGQRLLLLKGESTQSQSHVGILRGLAKYFNFILRYFK